MPTRASRPAPSSARSCSRSDRGSGRRIVQRVRIQRCRLDRVDGAKRGSAGLDRLLELGIRQLGPAFLAVLADGLERALFEVHDASVTRGARPETAGGSGGRSLFGSLLSRLEGNRRTFDCPIEYTATYSCPSKPERQGNARPTPTDGGSGATGAAFPARPHLRQGGSNA